MSGLRRAFALLALVLVLAPLVANAPLFDPDEGLHAAIAQEMNARRDYVTPTFFGEPFLDKPILFFWAEAVSLRVFGDREAAVRLPPLLFGVLGMLGVAALGRVLVDETTGLVSGIIYGTMLLPLGVSEVAVHDVAVVPFMCFACAALVRRGTGAARSTIVAGIALGLSILTKGLVAIAFTGLLAMCVAAFDRGAAVRLALRLAIAVAIAALVALPWYAAMEHAHPGYLHYYFVERHLQGYLTATQRHAGRGWWYYLPIVAGGTLPWTWYLVAAARHARANRALLVMWGWFAVGLVFLSAGESKLITYALPLFPALAILTGGAITAGSGLRDPSGYAIFATTLTVLPITALALVVWKYGSVAPGVWMIVGLISIAIGAVAATIARQPLDALAADLPRMLRLPIMALCGLMVVTPSAGAWMSARDLARWLNGAPLPSHVSVIGERIGSIVFYLSPPLRTEATPDRIESVSMPEAVSRIRVSAPDAVVAVRDDGVAHFNRLFATPPPPDARAGTFSVYRAATLQARLPGR